MITGLETFIRITSGVLLWLIVILLAFVIARLYFLVYRQRVNGILKSLFHVILAGEMYVAWSAIGAYTGLFYGQIQSYRIFRLVWWFGVVAWLFVTIVWSLVHITREIWFNDKVEQ